MVDEVGVVYGAALILVGLFSFFRKGSAISLLFALVFGAWSVYNAMHPTRQNNVANLAIAGVIGVLTLLKFLVGSRGLLGLVVIALSGFQVFRNYPYLK